MSERASEDLLDALHGSAAGAYLELIQKYSRGEILDRDGHPEPCPAALLTSATKFLKDNGVDRAVQPGDAVDRLAGQLPTFDEVADVMEARH